MHTSKKLALAIQLALAVGVGAAAPMAFAQDAGQSGQASSQDQSSQDQAKELQTVVVTGSRIRSVDVETAQPVFVMDRNDIQKTGLVTVGDILSHMTIQGSPTFNKQSVLASNTEQGGSYIDMRGLGASRVLVLVNGKRWVTGTEGMTDLSTIPSSVIQRIEVLKDGASAVYGSDAVAGVVNIITRKNYNGAEADVYYGQNQKGDGTTQQYSFTMGSVGEKGSVMMSASYNKQEVVWDKDRDFTRYPYGPRHVGEGYSVISPKAKIVTSSGLLSLNNLGDDATNIANYHPYTGATDDTFNANQQMMYRIPTEQKSLYVEGRYNFTDNLTFHSTAMYSERKSTTQIAGYPLYTGLAAAPSFGYDGTISKDSIYNPLNGVEDVGFYRRTIEQPRSSQNTNRAMHLDAGLEGWFTVGSHDWNWDAGVNWNKGSGLVVGTGNLNLVNVNRAIGPSFIDADGVARCGTNTPNGVIDGCIPWNVLGGPSAITPELRNYLFVQSQTGYGSKNVTYNANITGGLFDLGSGGTVAFAAGVERREVSGYQNTDQFSQSGLSTDLASGPTKGRYAVNSAYGELNVPLLRDLPGAQELTLNIASRYSKYSNFGSTTNSKYSFKWKPIEDLLVRGTYAQAFRAPTIMDMFGGASQTFDNYTDPCDAKFGATTFGADVHNACVASLTAAGYANAANFRQTDSTGNPVTTQNTQSTTPFIAGSNPDLDPEKATTKTFGLVYSPHYVQGLSLTLDWYQIKIKDIISSISSNDVLKNCYQGVQSYCGQFTRNSTGQVVNLNHSLTNMGTRDLEGYDFEILYRLPETTVGQFQVRSNSSYLVKSNSQSDPDAPVSTGASWYSIWRLRNNTSLDWKLGNFGATWTVRYFSGLKEACYFSDECNLPNFSAPDSGFSPSRRVGAVAFNDLSVRWDAPWNARITVGVNNIFDRDLTPMYAATDNAGSPPFNAAYDIDRYWFVGYNQKF